MAVRAETLPTHEFWIRCKGYFSDTAAHQSSWLSCKNGCIREIRSSPPDGADAIVMEDEPGYLVPLLADTHVHYYMEPWPLDPSNRMTPGAKPLEEEVRDAIGRVQNALAAGVGFLRDMGDPYGINLAVKREFAENGLPAPELLVPGPAMHRPKKYGRYLGVMRETVDDIKQTIDQLVDEQNVDYIKLVTTGIVNFEHSTVRQSPQFTVAELTDLVHYAHQRDRKVAAHCSGVDGLEIAIEAGVDFIEHAYFINDSLLSRLIDKRLVWTPTFVPVYTQYAHKECGWPEETLENMEQILADHNRMLRKAFDRGAILMAGTDAGCPGVEMGAGLRTELACMAKSGIDPKQLLRIATVTNAEICGARQYTGRIEVGGKASFGIYRQPPWEDIQHLDSLVNVFHEQHQFRGAASAI